jgi:hypothetical protein
MKEEQMAMINPAAQEGHQDGSNAANYEKVVGEHHLMKHPLTLEHATMYPDSYGCIKSQKDVETYNAAFSISYEALRPRRRLRRSVAQHRAERKGNT